MRLRNMSALAAGIMLTASTSLLSSCATLLLRPFNSRSHGSVYAEWAPHRDAGEWWYVTGALHGKQGGLWLYEFTIFHQATMFGQGYLLDLALSDYSTGTHYFEEQETGNPNKAYMKGKSIVFEGSALTLSKQGISVVAHGKQIDFDFSLKPTKPPVWEGNNGVEGMGGSNQPDQMSYYYSFTRLETRGELSYVDNTGTRVRERLTGSSWLDRQWGHFSQSGWDWFSIRLFDGTDVMLYAFPTTGFHQGTLIDKAGKTTTITDFSYTTDSWQTRGRSRYGLKWSVSLPIVGQRFRIVALSAKDFNPNRVIGYWEGLCRVYDKEGRLVGYAVEETTATAHRLAG